VTDAKDVSESAKRSVREKKILNSVVEKYNTLVPDAEKLTLDTILSDEIIWPWLLTHGGMYIILLNMLIGSYQISPQDQR